MPSLSFAKYDRRRAVTRLPLTKSKVQRGAGNAACNSSRLFLHQESAPERVSYTIARARSVQLSGKYKKAALFGLLFFVIDPVAQRHQAVCHMNILHNGIGVFLSDIKVAEIPEVFYA